MGKILKKFKKKNVTILMNRQRSKSQYMGSGYKGWEYAVWVEIQDKTNPEYGYEQTPNIFQDEKKANEYYREAVKWMKKDLKHAVWVYAPQIQHRL